MKRPLEFEMGDKVHLKVVPWKHILRFKIKKKKLTPRYIRPYEINKRVGPITYSWFCPPAWPRFMMCFIFHYYIKKNEIDSSRVLSPIPLEIEEDLTLKLKQKMILDRSEKVLRNKKILMIKVLRKNSQVKE
jgi:hypothetical protein